MGFCFWQPNKSKVQQAPWDRDELNDAKVQFHNLDLFLSHFDLYLSCTYRENIQLMRIFMFYLWIRNVILLSEPKQFLYLPCPIMLFGFRYCLKQQFSGDPTHTKLSIQMRKKESMSQECPCIHLFPSCPQIECLVFLKTGFVVSTSNASK